jgi:hypothetical protein
MMRVMASLIEERPDQAVDPTAMFHCTQDVEG